MTGQELQASADLLAQRFGGLPQIVLPISYIELAQPGGSDAFVFNHLEQAAGAQFTLANGVFNLGPAAPNRLYLQTLGWMLAAGAAAQPPIPLRITVGGSVVAQPVLAAPANSAATVIIPGPFKGGIAADAGVDNLGNAPAANTQQAVFGVFLVGP
jgi:hypothetical protein